MGVGNRGECVVWDCLCGGGVLCLCSLVVVYECGDEVSFDFGDVLEGDVSWVAVVLYCGESPYSVSCSCCVPCGGGVCGGWVLVSDLSV